MDVRDYLLGSLANWGQTHVFLVPGSLIDGFYGRFKDHGITPVVAASETGAAFMADGFGRASGNFGTCMGISGPGAANFFPALSAAKADGTAILSLVGEVDSRVTGRGAFQDAGVGGINDLQSIGYLCNAALQPEASASVPLFFRTAIRAMLGPPTGPAYLKIPSQLQDQSACSFPLSRPGSMTLARPPIVDPKSANDALRVILKDVEDNGVKRAPRVAILAGHGAVKSGSEHLLKRFANAAGIPVTTTMKAKGLLNEAEADSMCLGVFGYGGSPRAIAALTRADLRPEVLIVLGSSLTQRDLLFWHTSFAEMRIIHVDVNPRVIGRTFRADVEVIADVSTLLSHWLSTADSASVPRAIGIGPMLEKLRSDAVQRDAWVNQLVEIPHEESPPEETTKCGKLHPAGIVAAAREVVTAAGVSEPLVLVDSGAHRVFASHYYPMRESGLFLTAATMAPMGWAIAAAIGAYLGRKIEDKGEHIGRPALVFTGDGCMRMQGIEIHTAVRYMAHVVFIVLDNEALGNVTMRIAERNGRSLTELPPVRWVDFAVSLGMDKDRCQRVQSVEEFSRVLAKVLLAGQKASPGPALIHVPVGLVATPTKAYGQAKVGNSDELARLLELIEAHQ